MKRSVPALIFFCAILAADFAAAATHSVRLRYTDGDFFDVRDRVLMALENRGLVINFIAKVGDMLERTGRNVGCDRRMDCDVMRWTGTSAVS